MPATMPAPIRRAAEKATLSFDWLVPHKPFLQVREIAAATGMGETFVEDWFKAAEKYHAYNGGDGKRQTLRIPRLFAIELLITSAKYDAEAKMEAMLSCLREFSAADLQQIAAAATALAARKR